MHVGSCFHHGGCLPTISFGSFPLCAFGAAFCTLSTSRALESLCSRIGRGDVHWWCTIPDGLKSTLLHYVAGGQSWNWGRVVHSFGMYRWSVRRIAARRARVHFQMSALVVQPVRRCISISALAHLSHCFESARRIAANSSFVGMRSWIMLYYVDLSVFVITAVCRFLHIRSQSLRGHWEFSFPYCWWPPVP
jgi:hypothetical protein